MNRKLAERVFEQIFDDVNGPLVEMETAAFDHMHDIAQQHRSRIVDIIENAINGRPLPASIQEALNSGNGVYRP